jgi:transcriptional regulator with XRE-family HTH domain
MMADGSRIAAPEAIAGHEFGGMLSRWRKARRISQLDLALDAGVSSRHLSFVETGRARPSREMVLRLCAALDVPLRERNLLLLAAGFAPVHRETPLDAPEMAGMLGALRLILSRHDPYGAVAFDRNWDIVMASEAYAGLVNACPLLPDAPPIAPLTLTRTPRPNMLRLLCHPDGHRSHVVNWAEAARAVLARAVREAAQDDPDGARRALLAEVLAYPGVPTPEPAGAAAGAGAPLIVPVELRHGDGTIRLLSTIATLGTAEDITLRELRIEAFYPAEG